MNSFWSMTSFIGVLLFVFQVHSATPNEADLMLDQAHQKMIALVERMFTAGELSEIDKILVVSDLGAHKTAYKSYSKSASLAHTYLKNKRERDEHYVNKVLHMANRLENFALQPHGDIIDITEELTDFVPAAQKCGVPVDLPCVAREVEVRMDSIYLEINRRNSRVRTKFKTAADQGLHAAEVYSRILGTLRTDGGEAYASEYIYSKDRLVMGVKQEIEEGY